MRRIKDYYLAIFTVAILVLNGSCSKSANDTASLYIPKDSDVTANATLQELQQGRTLYINNCNSCHGLYSPDYYASSQWKNILSIMAPKTGMSTSEIQLVTKYVCKGK
jgi:hypothetical protein